MALSNCCLAASECPTANSCCPAVKQASEVAMSVRTGSSGFAAVTDAAARDAETAGVVVFGARAEVGATLLMLGPQAATNGSSARAIRQLADGRTIGRSAERRRLRTP